MRGLGTLMRMIYVAARITLLGHETRNRGHQNQHALKGSRPKKHVIIVDTWQTMQSASVCGRISGQIVLDCHMQTWVQQKKPGVQ